MAINTAELRKQSRLAARLTAVASLIVLISLAISYWITVRATQDLRAIQKQTLIAKQELAVTQRDLANLQQHIAALHSEKIALTTALAKWLPEMPRQQRN